MSEGGHAVFDKTITMLMLMVVVINFINVLHMKGIHSFSETSAFVIFGLVVGAASIGINMLTKSVDYNSDIQLSSNFFYLVLLPPIIFEGGFTLSRITFIRNFVPILGLALFGAIYSTVVTSGLMYAFSRVLYPSFTLIHSLVFGSIISSTDPVSVLGMLPPSVDRNLYMLIFGESALNDAVAIILFRFFTHLLHEEDSNGNISIGQFFESVGESVLIFVGSLAVGVIVALLFAKTIKHVRPPEAPIFELTMFLVFAYSSYLLAELIECTGIISIFFCGVAMAHYAYDNMSKVTLLAGKVVLRSLASMCDAFIFIYIGLGLVAFGKEQTQYNPGFIMAALFSILVSRTHVYVVANVWNLYSKTTHNPPRLIPGKHQVFLWYCGLRGAVSFSLAVQVLSYENVAADIRSLIFGTTMMVVVVTVILMGGFTPRVLRALGLSGDDAEHSGIEEKKHDEHTGPTETVAKTAKIDGASSGRKNSEQKSINTFDEYMPQNNEHGQSDDADQFMDTFNGSGLMMKLYEWDKRYIRPYFAADNRRNKKGDQLKPSPITVNDGNTYEIGADQIVVFGLDDSEDEFDRVSIAQAAEMIGIAGSTSYHRSIAPSLAASRNNLATFEMQALSASSAGRRPSTPRSATLAPDRRMSASSSRVVTRSEARIESITAEQLARPSSPLSPGGSAVGVTSPSGGSSGRRSVQASMSSFKATTSETDFDDTSSIDHVDLMSVSDSRPLRKK